MSGYNAIGGIFSLFARWALALIFFWSGMSKLLDPEGFALAVYRYHLMPGELVNMISLWIPVLEILCAVLIFIPSFRLPALGTLFILLGIFSLAIVVSITSGNTMVCGCFSTSVSAGAMGWTVLVRNAGLMVLIGMGAKRNAQFRNVPNIRL